MPKLKKSTPKLARRAKGQHQKGGKGWNTGQIVKAAKKSAARAESGRPAAREARERAAEQRYGTREPSRTAEAGEALNSGSKVTKARKRKRHQRERDGADASVVDDDERAAKRRERRAAAAELPKDIGASAPTRHAAFDRDGRSADALHVSPPSTTRAWRANISRSSAVRASWRRQQLYSAACFVIQRFDLSSRPRVPSSRRMLRWIGRCSTMWQT